VREGYTRSVNHTFRSIILRNDLPLRLNIEIVNKVWNIKTQESITNLLNWKRYILLSK
jgi:hypothetical protein